MSSLLIKPLVQHHLSRVRPVQLRDFPLAVEFWQPANDNIGAVSVVLDVVYKLRVARSCRAVLVFIHRQCVNNSKTSTEEVGACALLVK